MKQVTAAVIIEDGRLFLVRRAQGESLAGFWELPGGKREGSENLRDCLERELLEELAMTASVEVELARTVYHYEHGSFELVALRTQRLSDFELTVHDAFAWRSVENLGELNLAPADVELVGKLVAHGYWG